MNSATCARREASGTSSPSSSPGHPRPSQRSYAAPSARAPRPGARAALPACARCRHGARPWRPSRGGRRARTRGRAGSGAAAGSRSRGAASPAAAIRRLLGLVVELDRLDRDVVAEPLGLLVGVRVAADVDEQRGVVDAGSLLRRPGRSARRGAGRSGTGGARAPSAGRTRGRCRARAPRRAPRAGRGRGRRRRRSRGPRRPASAYSGSGTVVADPLPVGDGAVVHVLEGFDLVVLVEPELWMHAARGPGEVLVGEGPGELRAGGRCLGHQASHILLTCSINCRGPLRGGRPRRSGRARGAGGRSSSGRCSSWSSAARPWRSSPGRAPRWPPTPPRSPASTCSCWAGSSCGRAPWARTAGRSRSPCTMAGSPPGPGHARRADHRRRRRQAPGLAGLAARPRAPSASRCAAPVAKVTGRWLSVAAGQAGAHRLRPPGGERGGRRERQRRAAPLA